MKRILGLLLCLTCFVSLAACGKLDDKKDPIANEGGERAYNYVQEYINAGNALQEIFNYGSHIGTDFYTAFDVRRNQETGTNDTSYYDYVVEVYYSNPIYDGVAYHDFAVKCAYSFNDESAKKYGARDYSWWVQVNLDTIRAYNIATNYIEIRLDDKYVDEIIFSDDAYFRLGLSDAKFKEELSLAIKRAINSYRDYVELNGLNSALPL